MSIQFKTDRIRDEFTQLINKNDRLFYGLTAIALHAQDKWGKDVTLTSIYRTPEENKELYKNTAPLNVPKNQPHCDWDAADIRSLTFEKNEIDELVSFINSQYKNKNGRTASFCHTVAGNAPHFHIQLFKEG